MATGGTEDRKSELHCEWKCPICLGNLKKPKLLPCQHTGCEDCLSTYIKSTCMANGGTLLSFPCPVCRGIVIPPDPKAPVENWASLFPIGELLESVDCDKFSVVQACQTCESMGKSNTGTDWCEECSLFLCSWCKDYHKLLKATASHDIIPVIADMKNKFVSEADICTQHKEVLKAYCTEHRDICCVVCLVTQHGKCSNIKTLKEVAETAEDSDNDIDGVLKYLNYLHNTCALIFHQKKNNVMHLEQMRERDIQHLDALVTQARYKLDVFQNSSKNKLKNVCKEKIADLENKATHIQVFIQEVNRSRKVLLKTSTSGSSLQRFIATEKTKSRLRDHFEKLKKNVAKEKEFKIQMNVDEYFDELKDLFTEPVEVEMLEFDPDTTLEEIETLHLYPGSRVLYLTQTPVLMFTSKLSRPGDKYSDWSCGGTFLENGSIAIADTCNDKIKLYTEKGEFQSNLHMRDVTSICQGHLPDEIYVSVSCGYLHDNRILRLKCGKNIETVQTIVIDNSILDIAKGGASSLVVAFDSSIQLLNTQTSEFEMLVDNITEIDKRHVEVSGSSGNIFFTGKDSIMCCDDETNIIFRYEPESLKCPRGLALDPEGNVYVCDKETGKVHQVSSDGSKSRILLPDLDDITKPVSVAFHPNGDKFLIASGGNNESFAVYAFQ